MTMRRILARLTIAAILQVSATLSWAADAATPAAPAQAPDPIDNAVCLGCHGSEGLSTTGPDGKMRSLHVVADKFEGSVHGKRQCVECHKDITEVPHASVTQRKISCVMCHESLWEAARKEGKTEEAARLGIVVQMIASYMTSVHAQPNKEDQSRTNATCYNCHDAHAIYAKGSPNQAEWRLAIPEICGKCHAKERELYLTSVHGREVHEMRNPKAAVCSDCHSTHGVERPESDAARLHITQNCGNCHEESLKTYASTYHGQVNRLGYAHTAKCFDCHGSHGVQRVNDSRSSVHPDNRLKTCRKCHDGATQGFATFEPHGNPRDPERYPHIWAASTFMIGLLAGTFAFFWTHTALWFYREYRDRQERKTRLHVRTEGVIPEGARHFERFGMGWRVAHLVFAVSLMILTLTGMSLFYSDSAWAPVVIKALGGPNAAGIIHRIFATAFAAMFLGHLVYIARTIGRNWKTFHWFGPDSLIPNWQDLQDIYAMFRWFVGKGPRPVFDRWTYWEKFDYWAPFWGVTIIGVSGAMLWFHNVTASFLPGWVFNVATIFHGEEALLAALFLFTVHFFNNHFRPDKFPLDIVMFTGTMPIEEFRREHTKHYERLIETGELERHLVSEPSQPMTRASTILGFTLIAAGLALLALVIVGFIGTTF